MATSITLRQEKKTISSGYQVTSEIIASDPTSLTDVFVMKEGLDPWDETYEGVATLDDLDAYAGNPLVIFVAATAGKFNSISAQVGDVLTIDNASAEVPQWFTTNFTTAKFVVTEIDPSGNWVAVQGFKPFPTAAPGLDWTLRDSADVGLRGTGTGGYSRRESLAGSTTFLRAHVTAVLADVAKAESRASAIKTGLQSLVTASKTHGTLFEGLETETYL